MNRVDEIVLFEPLKEEHIAKVVDIQMGRLKALAADKRIAIEMTPAARLFLAKLGYDPVYGARPLKRAIQKHLQDPLAMQILSGAFVPGDTVRVDATGDALTLRAVARA